MVEQLASEEASPHTDAGLRKRQELLGRLSVLLRLGEGYDQALAYSHEHLKLTERIYGARTTIATLLRGLCAS